MTISGGSAVRVFSVNANISFTVVNLTIANGASPCGSAIQNLGGIVSLTGVTFSGNTAVGAASSDASGGAIWNQAGQVNLQSCALVLNRASGGDGVVSVPPPGTGGGTGSGGAIYNSGTMTLDLCTLSGNSATGGHGAVGYDSPGYDGGRGGGGAIVNCGTLTVDRSTFSDNTAAGGGGGVGDIGDPWDYWSGFTGGVGGDGYGGAIYCCGGSSLVSRSTFADNQAAGGTGGNGGNGVPGEVGGAGGGGGQGGSGSGGATSGAVSLVNCTLAFNTSSGGSGGIGGAGYGEGTFEYPGGSGGDGGSALGSVDGTCTNCTLAFNQGYAGPGGQGGPGRSGLGPRGTDGSAYGGPTSSLLVNTLLASNTPGGVDSFPDPMLGPLTNNGGPTLTMALLPGSPAIDAGNTSLAPATDQRGFPRPAGLAADIGAYEYGSVMPAIAISGSGATGLNILASGNAGQPCRLLSSADLLNWVPIATDQFGTNGTILFYDTYAPGSAYRFYRLVMP